jgi:hypothetical protein
VRARSIALPYAGRPAASRFAVTRRGCGYGFLGCPSPTLLGKAKTRRTRYANSATVPARTSGRSPRAVTAGAMDLIFSTAPSILPSSAHYLRRLAALLWLDDMRPPDVLAGRTGRWDRLFLDIPLARCLGCTTRELRAATPGALDGIRAF